MNLKLIKKLRIKTSYYSNFMLWKYFQFDKWHISPFYSRVYAYGLVNYLNSCNNRNSIIEIGCGIGGILRHLSFKNRIGGDVDEKALKAARFLSKIYFQEIKFIIFKFPDSQLVGCFDTIIMVNWVHNIEPNVLRDNITKYFHKNLTINGQIIVDIVNHHSYRFNHDIHFLTQNINCALYKIAEDVNNREVFSICRIQDARN